jgi:hypothetical protein
MAEPPVALHPAPKLLVNQALWERLNQKERRALLSAVELLLRRALEADSCIISPLADKRSSVETTSGDLTIRHQDNGIIIDHFVYKETMRRVLEDVLSSFSFAVHLWSK